MEACERMDLLFLKLDPELHPSEAVAFLVKGELQILKLTA
jgi:hypothetical protein